MHPATLIPLITLPLLSRAAPVNETTTASSNDGCDSGCKGTIGLRLDVASQHVQPGMIECVTEMKYNFGDAYNANGLPMGAKRNFIVLGGDGTTLQYDEKVIKSLFDCETSDFSFAYARSDANIPKKDGDGKEQKPEEKKPEEKKPEEKKDRKRADKAADDNGADKNGDKDKKPKDGKPAAWVISGMVKGADDAAKEKCVLDAVKMGLKKVGAKDDQISAVKCTKLQG